MRTRWLVPLTVSLGIVACNNDGGKGDQADNGDGEGSTTETGTTNGTTETETDTDDTTTGCTPGELGCECNNGLCLGDLECVAGTCVSSECSPGELGCECNNGLCLGDLECNNNLCSDPNCTPGELACECNNGLCLGDLVCENDVCVVGGDTDTDTTDTTDTDMDCSDANEKMCDGQCIDVSIHINNCGDCGNTCDVSMDMTVGGCEDGTCLPYWSECFLAQEFVTCNQACAAEGKACVQGGCANKTIVKGGAFLCDHGNTLGYETAAPTCDQPLTWQNATHWRCCCL